MFVSPICDSLKGYMKIKRLLFVQKFIFDKHILKSKFLIIILIYKCPLKTLNYFLMVKSFNI